MSEKVIFTSRVVLKISILSQRVYYIVILTIEGDQSLGKISYFYINIITNLLNYIYLYFCLCTMRWLWIIGSFDNMWLCDTIMRMRYNFCMGCTSGVYNSHISKKENGKNYDDADEFLIEKEHLILSIRIRWEKGKLFSGGNIPSPNQFFDKIFFFFSLSCKSFCTTTREMIFEKFTICTLQ